MLYKQNGTLRWSQENSEITDECGTSIANLSESQISFHWNHLLESSLGRIWQHVSDSTSFGIISPYLTDGPGKLSERENRERVPQMAQEIRDAGYGYVILNGYWINDKGEKVRERSFFVPTKGNSLKLLLLMEHLRKRYGQTAFAWKQAGDDDIYGISGETKRRYGRFHPDKLGYAYSEMKGGRSFVFESVYHLVDSGSARAFQAAGFRNMGLAIPQKTSL